MVNTLKRRLSDISESPNDDAPANNKTIKTEHDSGTTDQENLSRDQRQERIFANMRLRRIIKENHGCDINQLAFFFNNKNFSAPVGIDVNKTFDKRGSVQRDQTDTSNILATVGGCQVHHGFRIPCIIHTSY